MQMDDAQPVGARNTDGSDSSTSILSADDRSDVVSSIGIPSTPIVVFPQQTEGVLVVVDRQVVETLRQKVHRVYWHPNE